MNHKKALIIEDDLVVAELIGQLLFKQGIQSEIAGTARQALARFIGMKPDLIVLDIELPDANGLDILKQLRAYVEALDIPVLVVTVLTNKRCLDRAVQLGASGYLTKPFRLRDFRAAVEALYPKFT